MYETRLFNVEELETTLVQKTLEEIYDALEERGYNPINQLVGYLLSGDPGYISSYKDSRKKITSLDRAKIIETLLKNYIR
ncbi:MAG: IreB family regulatory phosphoprotein [Bacilli bacterium]|nr:IreB family regulatory phosphoprotein [Bacilli bacterium]